MSKPSRAFQSMKKALLRQLAAIPCGKVVGLDEMAVAMNVPARHLAYIVSQLSDDEQEMVPWYRMVPAGGRFPPVAKRTERHKTQILRLADDGLVDLTVVSKCLIAPPYDYSATFWADEDI